MRFGIEYTFVQYPGDRRCREDIAARLEHKGFPRAHTDPGVVEIPSPPHTDLKDAKRFFERLGKATAFERLVPRWITVYKNGDEFHSGTGGGHVHVELPKNRAEKTQLLQQLIFIMVKRPWLNWVFNEWGDTLNANWMYENGLVSSFIDNRGRFRASSCNDPFYRTSEMLCDNDYALRINNEYQTVEFRIFDAPRSWQQVKDHVDFALALVKWAQKRGKNFERAKTNFPTRQVGFYGRVAADFSKHYKTVEDVRRPFKKLIKQLGLDWKRYAKYLKNYSDRLKYGELT
jgi:hypothetical protein